MTKFFPNPYIDHGTIGFLFDTKVTIFMFGEKILDWQHEQATKIGRCEAQVLVEAVLGNPSGLITTTNPIRLNRSAFRGTPVNGNSFQWN
eukprot:scaffold7231_cov55-Cylindrotheca_fusiformis.AAC.1